MLSKLLKMVLIIALQSLLSQCGSLSDSLPVNTQQSAVISPYSQTTATYLERADNNAESPEAQSWLLLAAGRAVEEGQFSEARKILTQTAGLSGAQAAQKNILLAEIEVINNQPKKALALLAKVHLHNTSAFYQAQYHRILARAYTATANYNFAFLERIKLEPFFTNSPEGERNRRETWNVLMQTPKGDVLSLEENSTTDWLPQGWLELAFIARNAAPETLGVRLRKWQQQYANHPATTTLRKNSASILGHLSPIPTQVALLLPLTGSLNGPGKAIQAGFLTAARNASMKIISYDSANSDVVELYNQAVANGAHFVVGPLTKSNALKIAQIHHQVPTLVLNDTQTRAENNFFQLSISPQREAERVADKAGKMGLKNALIIAPEGEWGAAVSASFAARWQQHGGRVVESLSYNQKPSLSEAVRNFLHVTRKEAVRKQARVPESDMSAGPKRREDFDMIFLVAYPSVGRQIVPLLKYYFAGNIPVYATSSIYAGEKNVRKDKDLNGVIFCEYPQVFLQQAAEKNWPEQFNAYNRLFALGRNSFSVLSHFNQLQLFASVPGEEAGNLLSLHGAQVYNHLSFAQFRNGVALRKR